MYEALTKAYNEHNAKENERNKDKVFSYSLLDHKSFCEIQRGQCCNVIRHYNPCFDYEIISFTDIETGEEYSVCQFFVKLKEVEHN